VTVKKTLCALALAVASIGVLAPTAHAETPRCVTRVEYKRVHDGMSKHRVYRIFDIHGRRVAISRSGGGVTSEVRSYRTCRPNSAVSVAYGNGRVTAKSAIWG
jgi:hypothetical protein